MLKKILLLAATLVLALGCAKEKTIVIVTTNDIHSAIDQFPRLATLVSQERAAAPDAFLLIDAGDRWTGNPYVDRAPERYKPIIELMNRLGYDLGTFGNHEWDGGEQVLARRIDEAGFEKLMANADMSATAVGEIAPYKILEIDGMKIAVLALITVDEDGYPVGIAENFGQAKFSDPLATAPEYSYLRDSSDLFIALTHIGYEEDSLLAVRMPEIDLIIGGHSHTVVPPGKMINDVLVTQTGRYLQYAGVVTVKHKNGRVTSIENRLVELANLPADPQFQAMVDAYNNEPELKKSAGMLDTSLGKIGLLNLFSDIMREKAGADFAFYNVGGMRIDSLSAGNIAVADVYKAEPFDNRPVVVSMTLKQIADFILNKFNSTGKESHTLDLYPSGMTYRIITDQAGNATDIFFYPAYKNKNRKFKVVMSDYVNGKYIFEGQGEGVDVGGTIADSVFEYLSKNPTVSASNQSRVVIE